MCRSIVVWLVGLFLAAVPVQESFGQPARRADPVTLQSQRAGQTDVYILSFGLWGPQSVFESEAKGAAVPIRGVHGDLSIGSGCPSIADR